MRISLDDRDVPSYTKSLEHLVRSCARPACDLDRLSAVGGRDDQPERIRYALPRHKRGQWVHEFLSRVADVVPPPRRHCHRYHGVFAPNHPLRPLVTGHAIGDRPVVGEVPLTVLSFHSGLGGTA